MTPVLIDQDIIKHDTTPGYFYEATDVEVTIEAGIVVGSSGGIGVSSLVPGNKLINNGAVYSGADAAVSFKGGVIANSAGASMIGAVDGISVGPGWTIDNAGTVTGIQRYGVHAADSATESTLVNSGEIYGRIAGIFADGLGATGPLLRNSGVIRSDHRGIDVFGTGTFATTIDNAATGIIRGPDAAIATRASAKVLLNNDGRIDGAVDFNADADDIVNNRGTITGNVYLGRGDDTFNGKTGASGNLFGEDGDDTLIDGSGNETLFGGLGNDTLTGRAGKDRFVFDTALNALTNVDTITDFAARIDKIVLDHDVFTALVPGKLDAALFHVGAKAANANQLVIYDRSVGALYYDHDGKGGDAQVQFATLDAKLNLHNTDFIVIA